MITSLGLLVGALAFPMLTRAVPDERWARWCRRVAIVTMLAAWTAIVLQVPVSAQRGLSAVFDHDAWSSLLQTTAGKAAVVGAVLLTLAAVAASAGRGARARLPLLWALVGAAVVASVAAGHGSTGRHVPVGFLVTIAHLCAMGVWFGGLAVLAMITLRSAPDEGSEATVDRFSAAAFVAVAVLAATGVLLAWRQLPSLDALTSTTYGKLLLVKTGLVVVMVAIGGLSRQVVRRRSLSVRAVGAATAVGSATRSLRQRVVAEVAVGVAVLGVTAALMAANPAASSTGPVARALVQGDVIASLSLSPGRTGPNTLHVYLSGPGGSLQQFQEVQATVRLPKRDVGPLPVPLTLAGPDHYIATVDVPFKGRWTLQVSALVSEFDRRIFTTTFDAN